MPNLRRWLPLLGGAVLAVSTVLRLLGSGELADAIETTGSVVGVTSDPILSKTEIAAVVTQLVALWVWFQGARRKVTQEIAKAKAPDVPVVVVDETAPPPPPASKDPSRPIKP